MTRLGHFRVLQPRGRSSAGLDGARFHRTPLSGNYNVSSGGGRPWMVSWQDGEATRVLRRRCAISSARAGRGCPGLPRSASLRTWCTRTPGMITNMMITTPPDTLGQTVSRKVSQSQFLVAAVTDSDSCGTCLRSHHAANGVSCTGK